MVGFEATQTGLDGGYDVGAGEDVVGTGAHRAAALGGEDDGVARLPGQPVTHDLLGRTDLRRADRVDVRGVDEVGAAVVGGAHDAAGFVLSGLEAVGHGAEEDFGDARTGAPHASIFDASISVAAGVSPTCQFATRDHEEW